MAPQAPCFRSCAGRMRQHERPGSERGHGPDRLRRALLAFQAAQNSLQGTHRRLKGLVQVKVDAFWHGPGRRLEATLLATATEAVAAFEQFSAVGLVAGASDRHLVTQAQRHLAEDA